MNFSCSRYLRVLALSLLACIGCVDPSPTVNRVQTNLVDKSIFEGEWWVLQTVVEAAGDATYVGSEASVYAFPGGSAFTDLALDGGQSGAIGRIVWVIDERFLYAYRSYELIDGGNQDGRDEDFRGQPLAAYRIERHVDIRNAYNTFTGEVTNVLEENDRDRRWFERDYMRVDWSQNLSSSFAFLEDHIDLGRYRRESAPFLIPEEGAFDELPRSYAPQFVRVGDDPDYRFADEWPEEDADTVHYMSFTSMMMFSPGASCFRFSGGVCQTLSLPLRTAFLRVPPNHQYASAQQSYQSFDRFGTFRTLQRTYVRGGEDRSVLREYCDEDRDCGTESSPGYCDLDHNWCAGGLTSDLGELDFLTFYRPRHNISRQQLTDTDCRADWECNGLYPEAREGVRGSVCDRSAQRCTVPASIRDADENFRQVVYHLNDGFPHWMVPDAFAVIGEWNEVFMQGRRVTTGRALPDYRVAGNAVTPQADDPTEYCFVGSLDVRADGTCAGRYDPFRSRDEYVAAGVADPYDCQIVNVAGFTEPARPTSYDEYPIPVAYRYVFEGTECAFLLRSNRCDWFREDASVACDDVRDDDGARVRWEQQGDIRYQFFNYIDEVGVLFGGVSELRVDPTSGEIITADANYAGQITENMTFVANEWFPVLRCLGEAGCAEGEEGADERWTAGGPIRAYFQNLGRVELPRTLAPSGIEGTFFDPGTRPVFAEPARAEDRLAAARAFMAEHLPDVERLQSGSPDSFLQLGARFRNLAHTSIEGRLMDGMGRTGMQGFFGANSAATTTDVDPRSAMLDEQVLERVSPFRGNGHLEAVTAEELRTLELGEMGVDFTEYTDVFSFLRNRYWEYFAEVFRGRPTEEAAIRLSQMFMRNVQRHEMGHSVGLRHNFAGSIDRDHFGDGYFHLVVDGPEAARLPVRDEFDANGDGVNGGGELDAYYAALREARNLRAQRGAHNYMTASIMDYNGDLSDFYGLGRYDKAAVMWSHYDHVEAYTEDPRIESVDANDGLHRAHTTPRRWLEAYEGGQRCDTDADCPFNRARAGDSPVFQRCVRNPRNEENPRFTSPCTDGDEELCVCTDFDSDFSEYVEAFRDPASARLTGYDADVDGDSAIDHYPVRYQFCSDRRAFDLSWCTRHDAGESFQEIIDHYRREFYERYASAAYRRFRPSGARAGTSLQSILAVTKIFQHFYFRLFFEPGFEEDTGPLGFGNQIEASLDAANYLMELVNLPDEGSYVFDALSGHYAQVSDRQDMPGAEFSLAPGQGFGMWTQYQEGHQGFFRAERSGVFFDKWFAILGLLNRNWGNNFTVDERFNVNFFELYPDEVTEFIGGIILDEPRWFAPRVTFTDDGQPVIRHMTFNRGERFGDGLWRAEIPSQAEAYPEPALDGTTNATLRSWATVAALALIPTFGGNISDAVFEQSLRIFRLGEAEGFRIVDTRADGSPACAYGDARVDDAHLLVDPEVDDGCSSAEDATYAVYTSDDLATSFVSAKVRASVTRLNTEQESLGFQLLRKMVDTQRQLRQLEDVGDADGALELRRRLEEDESFLVYLLDVQQRFGIAN